jgi:hypothetical protein
MMTYLSGTVETLSFINMTNGNETLIANVTVDDKFNCKDFRYSIQFPDVIRHVYSTRNVQMIMTVMCLQEGFHNLSVIASNRLQNFTADVLTFEIVGQVRGLEITDDRVMTSKDEMKWFFLNFESIGAGTCVTMDFQDGIKQSFGDELYCAEWAPGIEYIPGIAMVPPVTITHPY